MAQPNLPDWRPLIDQGFELNLESGFGIIWNIGMTGNYWEATRFYDGKALGRELDDKAWVSAAQDVDPEGFENARLVRIALAHAIERAALFEALLDGFGDGPMYFAYQPPNNHPITLEHAYAYADPSRNGEGGAGGWEYPLDFDLAREMIAEAGFPDGFDMNNVWTGFGLGPELITAVTGTWAAELGINVTLNSASYLTYRPGLVARTTSEPFVGCTDDSNTAMPFDWARGFVMSSWSDGGAGAGMEVLFAAENYAAAAIETDKQKRLDLNERFAEQGIESALCIGIVHGPVGTMQNNELVDSWEKLPSANLNLHQFGNLESLVLK